MFRGESAGGRERAADDGEEGKLREKNHPLSVDKICCVCDVVIIHDRRERDESEETDDDGGDAARTSMLDFSHMRRLGGQNSETYSAESSASGAEKSIAHRAPLIVPQSSKRHAEFFLHAFGGLCLPDVLSFVVAFVVLRKHQLVDRSG